MARPTEQHELKSWSEASDSIWRLAFGPLIWALHFVATYGGTSIVCYKLGSHDWTMPVLRAGIGLITVLALAGIGLVAWRSWKRWDYLDDYDWEHDSPVEEDRHEFLGHAAFLLAMLSAVAVVYGALPAAFVSSCT